LSETQTTLERRDRELRREVVARVKAEAQARETQHWLSLLLEQAPIGCIEWNSDFVIREWNPGAAKLFG
jgi:PAS domain-containing protein